MQKTNTGFAHDRFEQYSNSLLINVFKQGPARLDKVLQGLTDEELFSFPIPGKWNILEIAIHVAHSEISGSMRIRQTITQSGRLFSYYDQDIWTLQLTRQAGRDRKSLEDHLSLFSLLRKTTSPIFEEASDDDWKKTGVHQEAGPLTLRQLLELYADHCERHIGQILERRKLLNNPIDIDQVLSQLLF